MRNIIILGMSRSGTSLAANLFNKSGYFQGDELLPPTISNPQGYFEDRNINHINNKIIHSILDWPFFNTIIRKRFSPIQNIDERSFAMASPLWVRKIQLERDILNEMQNYMLQTPFCYKDPRFSILIPYWKPMLPENTGIICMFRNPHSVAISQLKNAEIYTPPIKLTMNECNLAWFRNYKRILNKYSDENWLFIEYEMLLSKRAIPAIENFAQTSLDVSVINLDLNRSASKDNITYSKYLIKCEKIYKELKNVSLNNLNKWS